MFPKILISFKKLKIFSGEISRDVVTRSDWAVKWLSLMSIKKQTKKDRQSQKKQTKKERCRAVQTCKWVECCRASCFPLAPWNQRWRDRSAGRGRWGLHGWWPGSHQHSQCSSGHPQRWHQTGRDTQTTLLHTAASEMFVQYTYLTLKLSTNVCTVYLSHT